MYSFLLLGLFPLAALATVNGHCSGSAATGNWGTDGICVSTSTCTSYGGKYISGACPFDADNIKCCLVGLGPTVNYDPCGGVSFCDWTSGNTQCKADGGSLRSEGKCPGGSNYQCCIV
ncbi:hypothetical protein F5884DRAFT_763226 [Xylogone sp. PMI_703]|nr:hypothetical protein F5884DRAFT_763226 [Xylogone sp. PMI_703]